MSPPACGRSRAGRRARLLDERWLVPITGSSRSRRVRRQDATFSGTAPSSRTDQPRDRARRHALEDGPPPATRPNRSTRPRGRPPLLLFSSAPLLAFRPASSARRHIPPPQPTPPLAGLYIHVPFCSQRCVYCDFYVTTTNRAEDPFVRALEVEAEIMGAEFGKREPLKTLYLGGGTPSLLSPSALARVFRAVHDRFDASALEEVTIEANPEDLAGASGQTWLRAVRDLGATRLSLGVQSFFDQDLTFMNRAHDSAQAVAGLEAAVAEIGDVSVDLIFGIPDQPFEHWGANLERALRLGATHLSTYSLTVEDKTPLRKMVDVGQVVPEGDETMRERFVFTHDYLEDRGFEHYEVSSYSKPGLRSRHNEGYWTHQTSIGLGPSAHSFWRETRSRGWRWADVANLPRWRDLLFAGERPLDWREQIGPDELADEAVILGLRRLVDGLDLDVLEADYGVDLLRDKRAELAAFEGAGLVEVTPSRVRLTIEGAAVADAVALRLVG
ncbi:radical SAM family heme chaperone HemW [Rubrivirga sp.]|uniref:radical SAM family heme chaperone HemW n=1 Tax=Rubrivirga sp. TaxID=1885344 RepID=UPI003C70C8E4